MCIKTHALPLVAGFAAVIGAGVLLVGACAVPADRTGAPRATTSASPEARPTRLIGTLRFRNRVVTIAVGRVGVTYIANGEAVDLGMLVAQQGEHPMEFNGSEHLQPVGVAWAGSGL